MEVQRTETLLDVAVFSGILGAPGPVCDRDWVNLLTDRTYSTFTWNHLGLTSMVVGIWTCRTSLAKARTFLSLVVGPVLHPPK